jgi:hypothetical protein
MVLFVAGEETNSGKARNNLDRLTEELEGRCTVEVVDVLSNHNAALRWKILLTPALLVFAPGQKPVRITGNLDESKRVIAALGLKQRGHGA